MKRWMKSVVRNVHGQEMTCLSMIWVNYFVQSVFPNGYMKMKKKASRSRGVSMTDIFDATYEECVE